ncbi:ArsC family reductase [Shewanella gaetbuli]|uniref:ArsC family reductase n=1 Tax=Shewanella gaetbuli TaxID=220752 RepID=A0A9X2CGQ1_9GAMM|nr:ArsC family reductase [Shewanella gaetbuli]MCL1142638.1 ArsC family reductase [Shewanella gaetbuli]
MKLYGIKNCDTVRKARKWLENNTIEYQFHDFREQDLTEDVVSNWCEKLGWEVVFNKRSTSFRALDDAQKTDLNQQTAIKLMVEQPTLVKRPVLDNGTQVMVGFKEAEYKAWFQL